MKSGSQFCTKTNILCLLNNEARRSIDVKMTPAGLEPAIPGSVGRCLIHWATGPGDWPQIHSVC